MRYEQLREQAPPRIVLSYLDTAPLKQEDARAAKTGERKLRGGVMRAVDISTEKDGEWNQPEPGLRVWRLEVQSPGAEGLRLHLSDLNLTPGAQLFVYSPGSAQPVEVIHEPHKDWYSLVTDGDVARIELVDPGTSASLRVAAVGHLYRKAGTQESESQDADTCELDAACYPDEANAGASVARISYISGSTIFYCSGAMLNDNTGDFSPIFLTAHHCGVDSVSAPTLAVLFFYRNLSCNGSNQDGELQANGALVLGDAPAADATLLQLTGNIPRSVTWAGWSRDLPANGAAIFGIHHPQASYQRISFGSVVTGDPATAADFHSVQFSSGITEEGSSGSPLFNQNQQIIGQLYGGFSSCTDPSGVDIYGKLSQSYPSFLNQKGQNYLEVGLGDDSLFPNQSRDTASVLNAPGSLSNLVVKLTAEDWFKITVPANQQLSYTLTFGDGPLVTPEVYVGQSTTAVAGIGSSGFENKVLNDSPQAQDFYIHVKLGGGPFGTRATYGLTTKLNTAPVPTGVFEFVTQYRLNLVTVSESYASPWPATYVLQYSKDPAFSTFQQVNGGDLNGNISTASFFQLTDLDPATTYYFRAVVTNIAGSGMSSVQKVVMPAFMPPPIGSPQDGATGVLATIPLSWGNDGMGLPFNVYLGTQPDPPLVATTANLSYAAFPGGGSHAPYSTKYYWRLEETYKGITASTPVMSFTTEIGPMMSLSANPLNFTAWIYSHASSTVTITNNGSAWYEVDISATGGFGLQNGCPVAPNGMPPGYSCEVTLSKDRVQIGTYAGSLNIYAHNIFDPTVQLNTSVPVNLQVNDLVLSAARASRRSRAGAVGQAIKAGESQSFMLNIAPRAATNATVALSCGGLSEGTTCQVQPTVDLSAGAKDVEVVVSIAGRAQRLASETVARAARLGTSTAQTRNESVIVTANVGSATRTLVLPVMIAE